MDQRINNFQKGIAAIILVMLISSIVTLLVFSYGLITVNTARQSSNSVTSLHLYYMALSGAEDALLRYDGTQSGYSVPGFGMGVTDVAVSRSGLTATIDSMGDSGGRQRTIRVQGNIAPPDPLFYDTFNEGSNKLLIGAGHDPNVGTRWIEGPRRGGAQAYISNNRLHDDGVGGDGDGFVVLADFVSSPADYAVGVDVTKGDNNDDPITLFARWQDQDNTYAWMFTKDNIQTHMNKIYKHVSGESWQVIASGCDTINDPDKATFEVSGTSPVTLRAFKNGSLACEGVDNSSQITGAGRGGIGHGAFINTNDDLSDQRTDNFEILPLNAPGIFTVSDIFFN